MTISRVVTYFNTFLAKKSYTGCQISKFRCFGEEKIQMRPGFLIRKNLWFYANSYSAFFISNLANFNYKVRFYS